MAQCVVAWGKLLSCSLLAVTGICEQTIKVQFNFYPTKHSPEASKHRGM